MEVIENILLRAQQSIRKEGLRFPELSGKGLVGKLRT